MYLIPEGNKDHIHGEREAKQVCSAEGAFGMGRVASTMPVKLPDVEFPESQEMASWNSGGQWGRWVCREYRMGAGLRTGLCSQEGAGVWQAVGAGEQRRPSPAR